MVQYFSSTCRGFERNINFNISGFYSLTDHFSPFSVPLKIEHSWRQAYGQKQQRHTSNVPGILCSQLAHNNMITKKPVRPLVIFMSSFSTGHDSLGIQLLHTAFAMILSISGATHAIAPSSI